MGKGWPFNLLNKTEDKTQERNFEVPDKVYARGNEPIEYTLDHPAHNLNYIDSLLDGYYSPRNYLELFYCLPEIYSAVNFIARAVSDSNFQLIKEWNDEVDYKDADFNRLFSKPNPLQIHKELVYEAVCYEILTGKNFFYFNHNNLLALLDTKPKRTITWSNLAASHVIIDTFKNIDPYSATSMSDFIQQYRIPTADGKYRIFPSEKVVPILNRDLKKPFDFNKTIPLIKGADKAIKNLIPVYEARGKIYIKGGPQGAWVSKKADNDGLKAISTAEKKEAVDEMNREYGLTGNRSPVAVLKAPMDFIRAGSSIQELQPFEETLQDAVAIYATLGIPRHHVPSKDHSTFSNAKEDDKQFYTSVVIPWAKRYADIFTEAFEYRKERRYIKPNFEHIEVLQENKKEKADVDKVNTTTYELQWKNGVITLNDWIVASGYEKQTGPVFEKRLPEMTPQELEMVKSFINLKTISNATTPEGAGTQKEGNTNNL